MRLYFVVIIFLSAQGLERQLNYKKNPGCESYNISLVYIMAVGPNDTLHYLWDFTTRPTLFLALSDNGNNLNINCKSFISAEGRSFNFTKPPIYEFFLIINKLIEFSDVNNTGILTSDSPTVNYDTKDFSWNVEEKLRVGREGSFVSMSMSGTNYNQSGITLAGNLTIELTAFGVENHDGVLPRLMHSPNSTQCKITLENLLSNSAFNETRFAISMILVSDDIRNSSSKIVTRKNLDDENSPGIFSMVDVMTPKAQDQKFRGAFLQWRPIIYVTKVPSIGNSSEILAYNLTSVADFEDVDWLPFKYYGDDIGNVLMEKAVVSLGMMDDGFYKETNYSSWTFLVSFGSPEKEKFSLLVVLVMCIGLGLPALLMIIGGIYMCFRRIRRSKDELSLER